MQRRCWAIAAFAFGRQMTGRNGVCAIVCLYLIPRMYAVQRNAQAVQWRDKSGLSFCLVSIASFEQALRCIWQSRR